MGEVHQTYSLQRTATSKSDRVLAAVNQELSADWPAGDDLSRCDRYTIRPDRVRGWKTMLIYCACRSTVARGEITTHFHGAVSAPRTWFASSMLVVPPDPISEMDLF